MQATQISLDDLIKKDRQERKGKLVRNREQKTKPIHKTYTNNNKHSSQKPPRRQYQRQPRQKQEHIRPRVPLDPLAQRYTLLVKGFVADVSTEDIYNLLKNRKVTSIKTYLDGVDNKPIEYSKEMPIDVKITFANKDDADSFMKEYSSKRLDGKHNLSFTFVRR